MEQPVLDEVRGHWEAGRPLETGRLLYENLPADTHPRWAAAVLSLARKQMPEIDEVESILKIANDPSRWSEAKEAFEAIRQLTLASQEPLHEAILILAENVAKVIYNSSGPSDPFDQDAGWWVVQNLHYITQQIDDSAFTSEAWMVLSGEKLNELKMLRFLSLGDYIIGLKGQFYMPLLFQILEGHPFIIRPKQDAHHFYNYTLKTESGQASIITIAGGLKSLKLDSADIDRDFTDIVSVEFGLSALPEFIDELIDLFEQFGQKSTFTIEITNYSRGPDNAKFKVNDYQELKDDYQQTYEKWVKNVDYWKLYLEIN